MAEERRITLSDARGIGDRLGADWATIDAAEFRRGIEVEREEVGDDEAAGRRALARLLEVPDYYTRLDELAAAAEKHRARRFRI